MLLRPLVLLCIAAAWLGYTVPALAQSDDTVECHSRGYKYTECEAPFRHPRLVQQLSDSECVANKNWGYNRDTRSIWVSEGCSAVFADANARDSERNRDDNDYSGSRDDRRDNRRDNERRREIVQCRSMDYAFLRCGTNWERARLVEQLSSTRCVEGENWGIDADGLWVDKGCGGRFTGE